jgi:diguanylate cyclase (GGDEF)-like protein/putative nucleotidyltransferase with HDIG domain
MGHRVDRLAEHLRSSPGAERPLAGRVGGALWLIAAVATLALPLFPHVDAPMFGWTAALALASATWGVLAIFVIDWRTAPGWWLPTANAAAIVVIGAMTSLTGGVDSPTRLYAFFALVYAASFLAVPQAIGLIISCALVWALPVATDRGLGAALGELTLTLPIFGIVGIVLLAGRQLLTAMRDAAERLSEEHHALRTLATAVAAGNDPEAVYRHAAEQAVKLLGADAGGIIRFDPDDAMAVVGVYSHDGALPRPDVSVPLDPASPTAELRRGNCALRIDDHSTRTDDHSRALSALGYKAWAGSPVRVRGRLWGAISVMAIDSSTLRADAEVHLAEFAELVGMAVANTEEAARLAADATTDPLTGLANHRRFQERLRAELARAARHDRTLALALVDIDHFKAVNDAGGHAVGDEVLCAVAEHLREHLRGEDVLARIGGDEFALLLPESDAASAAAALERARQTVERAPLRAGARVTISVGICDLTHARDAESLARFADGALYWSKEHGRNRVSTYDPGTIVELSAAERLGELQRSQALVGIRALARAIDARDPSTSRHSERVAELAARLAEARGWAPARVALLHEAALVHDVGKIGIPDAILLKPARLTPEEYEVIKQHADLGARIVEDVLGPEQVDWIRAHHERPDGRGYPRGLVAAQLSEGAGLLAAADAFDVMVSARPYSAERPPEDALAECHELAGAQFTHEAVEALERIYGGAGVELRDAA